MKNLLIPVLAGILIAAECRADVVVYHSKETTNVTGHVATDSDEHGETIYEPGSHRIIQENVLIFDKKNRKFVDVYLYNTYPKGKRVISGFYASQVYDSAELMKEILPVNSGKQKFEVCDSAIGKTSTLTTKEGLKVQLAKVLTGVNCQSQVNGRYNEEAEEYVYDLALGVVYFNTRTELRLDVPLTARLYSGSLEAAVEVVRKGLKAKGYTDYSEQ